LSPNDDGQFALQLHEITKRFASLTALDGVSLNIRRGRITALLGENGAGKTTLMRVAFGMIQPDAGSISVNGAPRVLRSPADAIAAGIGMVHQQFSLVPAMTVAENVALGGHGKYSTARVASQLNEIAQRTGLSLDPNAQVADLGSADRQKLEIIRTLAHNASILILDEPTAVLTVSDVSELFRQLKAFAANGGSVVLITHKLADARANADDVAVLRRGKLVLDSEMNSVTEAALAEAMLGSAIESRTHGAVQKRTKSAVLASFKSAVFADNPGRQPVDMEVNGGEIVGIAALEGAARGILRALAGREEVIAGSVEIPQRVGFVPENRKDEALITDFSLSENLALRNAGTRTGLIEWREVRAQAQQVIREFNVRAQSSEVFPSQLSGGNQQRFVLGRELQDDPSLLVLENPAQGLDVSAAAFVHDRLRQTRDTGSAVVYYSSDLDELAEIADRVIVVSRTGMKTVRPDRGEIGDALLGVDG
jgi:simple sugar transport system ATP-binding protein